MVYFLLLFNCIRFGFLNLFNKNFNSSFLQRIHPSVSIKLVQNGKIALGKNLDISKNCTLIATNNGEIHIGEKVFMNQNCSISSKAKITIGDNCNFGPNVCVFDNNHKFSALKGVSATEYSFGEISIGSGTWIASNVVILKNTKIGKNCVIGAGCTISGTIPDATLVFMEQNQIQKPIV
jgi:acetyltransferase-like isoleucine patch superfamily enzyme